MEGYALKVLFLLLISSPSRMVIVSFPIYNGFSVKFSPLSVKEEAKKKEFGSIFTKVPQDIADQDYWKDILSEAYSLVEETPGQTNQIAKLPGIKKKEVVDTSVGSLVLPLLEQPSNCYRILVATAPPNFKLYDDVPTFVYIIYPDDVKEPKSGIIVPTVYFVKSSDFKSESKDKEEQIYIVDSNRTVTGIRSKKVPKYVNFRNRLLNRFDYDVKL